MKKLSKKQTKELLVDLGESKRGFIGVQTTLLELVTNAVGLVEGGWGGFNIIAENYLPVFNNVTVYGWYRETKKDKEMTGTILIKCDENVAGAIDNRGVLVYKGKSKLKGFSEFVDGFSEE